MNLTFLGNTYTAQNTPVDAVETPTQASFLGRKYAVRRHQVSTSPSPIARKYRGIAY